MKKAFTLAEVLITLGVVGIVAALTIPMLAKNYQFYIRQQQFKKAYAALNIAIQKTQIDMGEGVRCFYLKNNFYAGDFTDCKFFYNELAKELNIMRACENQAYAKGCLPKNFRGGDLVYSEVQGGDDKDAALAEFRRGCPGFSEDRIKNIAPVYMSNAGFYYVPYYGDVAIFLLDVNGHSAPNKWGHDIFVLHFNKDKMTDSVFKIVPSIHCRALDFGGYYTNHFMQYLYGQNAEL